MAKMWKNTNNSSDSEEQEESESSDNEEKQGHFPLPLSNVDKDEEFSDESGSDEEN